MRNVESLYVIIAGNIRKEWKKLCISQAGLAEWADISIDTAKSVEGGRRAMSLDTYLRIVQALETMPMALMNNEQPEEYMERFFFLVAGRGEREIEYMCYILWSIFSRESIYAFVVCRYCVVLTFMI